MNNNIATNIQSALLSPLFILSVCIMVINDHILKGSGIIHPVITGKISDFAFLFFVPVVVAYIFRVKTTTGLYISYSIMGILFTAINIIPYFSRFIESLFHKAYIPLSLWPDKTDLIALTIIPLSIFYLLNKKKSKPVKQRKWIEFCIVIFCSISCAATSPRIPPTHEPVYMSWKEFREAVEVMPPQKIRRRGKIYLKDNYLYVNEPDKGIHIFDNTDPQNPIPKGFLKIPGNIDISIKGSYLYADSFVDLLVFALTIHPEDIILVNRIENIFPYTPSQFPNVAEVDDSNNRIHFIPAYVNKEKGVVTGWRPIQGR